MYTHLLLTVALFTLQTAASAEELRVLFLGDHGLHRPADRFPELARPLSQRGVELTYTDRLEDLNAKTLAEYDAVLLYANIDRIEMPEEQALLRYVAEGGGFVPLHCATYCFRNSSELVALMGGQFQRHGAGVFRTRIAQPDHPIMSGFSGFESWDETYVHHLHNERDRTVLAYRVDAEGREPYTWVRTHGKGRVFYTAWGHDHRTWRNPGFHNLVERGIRWAARSDVSKVPNYQSDLPFQVPEMTRIRGDLAPLEYLDVGAQIPNYTPGTSWGRQGPSFTQMQQPLSPEESIKHISVPKGFRVELFASERDFAGKPICMAWDERGRLWVGETTEYPNELQPPGKGRDRIRICEDVDGDGRADKFTVFAENLSMPTAIALTGRGAIVQSGTETLLLEDRDGDDQVDVRSVMFTGWNMQDTHGGVSNFQYGLDNWIWAMQGYNQSRPEWNGRKHSGFAQGFFRFRPDGSELEFIRSTNNNTWGLGISEEGLIFGSTANENPSVFMPIANRYFERVRGWTPSLRLESIADTHLFQPITDRVRQVDQFGGYTAGAGHAIYTARTYPEPYWNRTAFVCGPTGHLVGTFVLKSDGGNFRSSSPCNLMASDDEWTAPIMAEVGPDGSVWVIDWYNFIIQHNPTPSGFKKGAGNAYESELRDKTHGRILRIVYDASQAVPRKSLAGATPAELISALQDSNFLWRRHAQRLLVERGNQDVADPLLGLIRNRNVDRLGLNVGAIHALWTLEGLGLLDGQHAEAAVAVRAALEHPAPGVRLNALRMLPPDLESVDAILQSGVLDDADAQVRLAALLALADLPPAPGVAEELVLRAMSAAGDRVLTDATIVAAARNDVDFLKAALASTQGYVALEPIVEIVAEHFARSGSRQAAPALIRQMQLAKRPLVRATLAGLVRGWPSEAVLELGEEEDLALEDLAERLDLGSRGRLIKLAEVWGSKRLAVYADQLIREYVNRVGDPQASAKQRLASARQLIELAGDEDAAVEQLIEQITPQTPSELASGVIASLSSSDAPGVGSALIDKIASLTPAVRRAAIAVLLDREASTASLLAGLDDGRLLATELNVQQRRALLEHPNEQLSRLAADLLERRGILPSPDRQAVLQQLLPLTEQVGDAANGKLVYTKNCANCHVHSGEGTPVGPNLTGMAVHPKHELLTHIIDPSRSVEGNFRLYNVLTVQGRTLAGMLAGESQTSIELIDSQGKKQAILREDIQELLASSKSMMPDGFEKQISTDQLRDLLEFLTHRGEFLPIDLSRAATITSVRGMFYDEEATEERLIFPDWSPKRFEGVPFQLVDPLDGDAQNVIMLYSPNGSSPREMPKQVRVDVNSPAKALHLLSGVSGWGYRGGSSEQKLTMTVRLTYNDGAEEDHPFFDGIHFADYIRRVDVPASKFAFALREQQIRYLAIHPRRSAGIRYIDFVKGDDDSAPIVMALTLESLD